MPLVKDERNVCTLALKPTHHDEAVARRVGPRAVTLAIHDHGVDSDVCAVQSKALQHHCCTLSVQGHKLARRVLGNARE
jgi:hypothetical protein